MLITCPECGNQISDQATACPHCGMPLNKGTLPESHDDISVMCQPAKVFAVLEGILLAFFLIIGLCCIAVSVPAAILIIAAVAIVAVYDWLSFKQCYVSLTGTTITGHLGVIKSRKLVSPVSKVQDISISNGLLGKIFRYHTIIISTAGSGGAEYVYKHMANAKELQSAFVRLSNEVK